MWKDEFYETKNKKIPMELFLDSLNIKLRAKIIRDILLLQELGTSIREPYSKPIKNGLFELRTKFSSDTVRVFYFFFYNKRIIITNGFIKKTRKIPTLEIEKAVQYKLDYERRQ